MSGISTVSSGFVAMPLAPSTLHAIPLAILQKFYIAAGDGDAALVAQMIQEDPTLLDVERWEEYQGYGNGATPLHYALVEGRGDVLGVVKALVEGGVRVAPVNLEDVSRNALGGNRALGVAVAKNRLDVVKYLQEQGADVNAVNSHGQGLLYISIKEGNSLDVIKCLVEECGATVDVFDRNGKTPFYYAVHDKRFDVALYLRQKGAMVDTVDPLGWTLCYGAAVRGDLPTVQFLVNECNADINVVAWTGRTALEMLKRESERLSNPVAWTGLTESEAIKLRQERLDIIAFARTGHSVCEMPKLSQERLDVNESNADSNPVNWTGRREFETLKLRQERLTIIAFLEEVSARRLT